MIELVEGDLLEAPVDALVNAVNCVGIMGRGLAVEFKRRFPRNYRCYAKACRYGFVIPGFVFVVPLGIPQPKYIVNFPTKRHWKDAARLEDVERGLANLVRQIEAFGIRSIAIPALGCGLGGLDWRAVEPLIASALAEVPEVQALVYAPRAVA